MKLYELWGGGCLVSRFYFYFHKKSFVILAYNEILEYFHFDDCVSIVWNSRDLHPIFSNLKKEEKKIAIPEEILSTSKYMNENHQKRLKTNSHFVFTFFEMFFASGNICYISVVLNTSFHNIMARVKKKKYVHRVIKFRV